MKRVIVCGDSFMSPRNNHPNRHFAEIFSKNKNFELTCYARSAFSNGGIIIQIETALLQQPDLILFNISNHTRTEIAVSLQRDPTFEEINRFTDPFLIEEVGDLHHRPNELSDRFYEDTTKQRLISLNYHSLVIDHPFEQEEFTNKMSQKYIDWKEKSETVKNQFKYLYDDKWKRQIDCMMIYAVLHKLHRSEIPYIMVHDYVNIFNSGYAPYWFTEKNSIHDKVHNIRISISDLSYQDPGFHLTYEASEQVAQILTEHYDTYF